MYCMYAMKSAGSCAKLLAVIINSPDLLKTAHDLSWSSELGQHTSHFPACMYKNMVIEMQADSAL